MRVYGILPLAFLVALAVVGLVMTTTSAPAKPAVVQVPATCAALGKIDWEQGKIVLCSATFFPVSGYATGHWEPNGPYLVQVTDSQLPLTICGRKWVILPPGFYDLDDRSDICPSRP